MALQPDISSAFSSQARFRVLQALALLTQGLQLRELERACRLGIRSVQVATEGLIKERVLKRSHDGRFVLNSNSPLSNRIRGLFRHLRDEELREKAKALAHRAHQVLLLSDEVRSLIAHPGKTR